MNNQQVFDTNEVATKYYQSLILADERKIAMDYLNKHSISKETITNFRLGYSGTAKRGLVEHLNLLGYTDNQIIEIGLAEKDENDETSDVFQNRLIIPVIDDENRVIGFSGRSLDMECPIYLNSRSNDVFDKSKNLFGLNIAKNASTDYLILCEGYMDVISLNQAGFNMATAILGIEFTAGQVNLLKKYTSKVLVCFDTDDFGKKGADSAIKILAEYGIEGLKIDLSPFRDPMDMITKEGADAFRERLGC